MSAGSATLAPEPGRWGQLVAGARVDGRARRFREQLGLATDRPVVMTGHQAEFWHAGILAKYLAADAAGRALGAAPAWLVVDQDENDPLTVRCPVREAGGGLGVAEVELGRSEGAGGPTGRRRAGRPVEADDVEWATESVRAGVDAMREALGSHQDAPSLAAQVLGAQRELLQPLGLDAPAVCATALSSTDLFGELVGRMAEEPRACARAYNGAVAASGEAGLRTLADGERVELPLWRLDGAARRAVFGEDLGGLDASVLAPRALLMTGMLRLAGCELFVHGTGAGGADGRGGYEAVADAWLEGWLGERPRGRVAVATATLTLDLPGEAPSEEEVAAAKKRAHKARHDPSIVGDEAAARRKGELVEAIRRAKASGEDASGLFDRMQSLLGEYRARHEGDFAAVDEEAAGLERRLGEREIREDRTWAFPLHGRGALAGLKAEVDGAFGV